MLNQAGAGFLSMLLIWMVFAGTGPEADAPLGSPASGSDPILPGAFIANEGQVQPKAMQVPRPP